MEISIEKESEEKEGFKDYEIKDALSTLKRAEEIKKDSKLMAEVKKLAAKEVTAIKSIADIKARASKMPLDEEA